MKSKYVWAFAGTVAVATAITVGVHNPGTDAAPTTTIGTVIAETAVSDALGANKCTYMTKSGDDTGINTVVLVSRTGAMAAASLPGALLTELAQTRGGQGSPTGSITLLTVGGDGEAPQIVLDHAALTDPDAGTSRDQRLAESLPTCVTSALDASAGPTKPGSDELLAQQMAAYSGTDRVYVVSDGEANTGLLDLRYQNYPVGDPTEAVSRVQAAGQVPAFAGMHVTYYGIGQNRTEAERTWLTAFYLDLCSTAGGTCTAAKDLVPVAATAANDVPDDPPLEAVTEVSDGPRTVFRVDSAAFVASTTELIDPDAVISALNSIAEIAKTSRPQVILIGGHACDDGSPKPELQQISQDRAQRIAELLRSEGVKTPIRATGYGADEPIAGPQPDGSYSYAQCAANRRVEIVLE